MAEKYKELGLKPVGFVRSAIKESPKGDDWWQDVVSEIIVNEELTEALEEIDYYKSLIILYWIHKRNRSNIAMQVNPKGRKDVPMRGIFATRTPDRPNPIGLITVRLLKREANVLTVRGLDALDGTPVLDIKPWSSGYDSPDGDESAVG